MNVAARLPADFLPDRMSGLERTAYVSLLAFAAAPQFSIAVSNVLLGLSGLLWLALLVVNRERIEVPRMFWPLAAYAGATLDRGVFLGLAADELARTANSSSSSQSYRSPIDCFAASAASPPSTWSSPSAP